MLEVNGNSDRLARSYNELVELQLVLEKAGSFFDQARVEAAAENFERSYSTQEDMGAPLLEAALPVRGEVGVGGVGGRRGDSRMGQGRGPGERYAEAGLPVPPLPSSASRSIPRLQLCLALMRCPPLRPPAPPPPPLPFRPACPPGGAQGRPPGFCGGAHPAGQAQRL
jgi:hypothetical protein